MTTRKQSGEACQSYSVCSIHYDNVATLFVIITAQFGAWELGPQHGFARISQWKLQQEPTKVVLLQ